MMSKEKWHAVNMTSKEKLHDVTINDGHLTEAHQRNTAYEPCLIATVLQLALAI